MVACEAPGCEAVWLRSPPRRPDCGPIMARFLDHAEYVRRLRRGMEFGQVVAVGCGVCKTVGSAYVGSNPTPATSQCTSSARCRAFRRALAVCSQMPRNAAVTLRVGYMWDDRTPGRAVCQRPSWSAASIRALARSWPSSRHLAYTRSSTSTL